jgi:uncharacterized membrane protein YkvA (DUF1232 family)
MGYTAKLREQGRQLKTHVYALYHGMHDPRVPWYAKLLTLLVIAYVISPVDIIPDFIPVLGLLDEVILVPIALALIIKLVPEEVIREYQTQQQEIKSRGLKIAGVLIVVMIWLLLILFFYYMWLQAG